MTERMFRAPVLSSLWDSCTGHLQAINVRTAEVSYDYAADISNNIWGGPTVFIHSSSKRWNRAGGLEHELWQVSVMGFIVEEALEVMLAIEEMLDNEGPEKYANYYGQNWRFRDGELVPDELARVGV
jgi:hypothetical protein